MSNDNAPNRNGVSLNRDAVLPPLRPDVHPSSLFQLIYVSRSTAATHAARHADLAAIVEASLRNNPAHGITGALTLVGGRFAQVVEGTRQELEGLYQRIVTDHRHTDICLLRFAAAERRSFTGWAMATPAHMTETLVLWACDAYEEGPRNADSAATMLVNALVARTPIAA